MPSGGNSTKVLNQMTFLERCRESFGDRFINYNWTDIEYRNARSDITLTCKKHGQFKVLAQKVLTGIGCNICDKLSEPNRQVLLSLPEYKEVAASIHLGKYDYSMVNLGNFKDLKIPIICKTHGVFMMRKSAHISPKQQYGCVKCAKGKSKVEAVIERWLADRKIEYVHQKTFTGFVARSNQKYPFDFYIPSSDLLIEFDGIHHFKPVKFSKKQTTESTERKFEQVKRNDAAKNKYVIDHGLRLTRINYNRGSDIENILNYEIFGITGKNFDTPGVSKYSNPDDGAFEFRHYA